jgi:hypothetical protein
MFDGDDPETLMNELLVGVLVPAVVLFVAVWLSFRLVFDDALSSMGLEPMTPAPGGGAVATGFGRFLLVMVVTAVLTVVYLGVYARFLRGPLRRRGLV